MVRLEKGSISQKKRSRSSLDYRKPKNSETTMIADFEYTSYTKDDLKAMSPLELKELLKTHPELATLVEEETLRFQQQQTMYRSSDPPSSSSRGRPPTTPTTKRHSSRATTDQQQREFPYIQWISLIILVSIATLSYVSSKQKKQRNQRKGALRVPEESLVQDLKDVVVTHKRRPPANTKQSKKKKASHTNKKTTVESSVSTTTKAAAAIKTTKTITTTVETAEFEVGEWTTVFKQKAKPNGGEGDTADPAETVPATKSSTDNGVSNKDNGAESDNLNGGSDRPPLMSNGTTHEPTTKHDEPMDTPEQQQKEEPPVAKKTNKKKKHKKAKQPRQEVTTTDNDAALAIQLQMEEERLAVPETAAVDEWEEVTKKKTKQAK